MKNLKEFINESLINESLINESKIKGLDKMEIFIKSPNKKLIKQVMADEIGDGDTSMISASDIKDMINILKLTCDYFREAEEDELDMGEYIPYVVDRIDSKVVNEEIMEDYISAISTLWSEITKTSWPEE